MREFRTFGYGELTITEHMGSIFLCGVGRPFLVDGLLVTRLQPRPDL